MRELNTNHQTFPIHEENDIIVTRQAIRALASQWGFDSFATSALITIASELTRNIWNYAGEGEVCVELLEERQRVGMRLRFSDRGPGIEDVERVLAGGYSQGASLGLGLSGSRRLADEFDIKSTPGKGTEICIVKWKNRA